MKDIAIHYFVIMGFVVLAYSGSLHVPFVFDDIPNIVANPAVHPNGISELSKSFNSPVSGSRPVPLFTFGMNYLFGELNVYGYHVVNILFHIINALILYLCIIEIYKLDLFKREIDKAKDIAFYSSLLWAVNPVHTQAVTYIVQRMTLMSSTFYLLSILLFVRYLNRKLSTLKLVVLILALFVLGMLSKEIMVTLPVTLAVVWCVFEDCNKNYIKVFLPTVLVVFVVGLAYLGWELPNFFEKYPNRNFSPYERLLTESKILWHYISLYFLPIPERMYLDYGGEVSRGLVQPITTLFGMIGVGAALYVSVIYRSRIPATSFAIIFFFVTSSVEASFVNLELAFIHRLYLPSVFIVFGMISLVSTHSRGKIFPIALLVAAVFTYWTIERNNEWNHQLSFWQKNAERGGGEPRSMLNRSFELMMLGRAGEAKKILNDAESEYVGTNVWERVNLQLALASYMLGDCDESLERYESHMKLYSNDPDALFYSALCMISQRNYQGARLVVQTLSLAPSSVAYSSILNAKLIAEQKNPYEGISILEKALPAIPSDMTEKRILSHLFLADMYISISDFNSAYNTYKKVLDIDPNNYHSWQQIYKMKIQSGDLERAEKIADFLKSRDASLQ